MILHFSKTACLKLLLHCLCFYLLSHFTTPSTRSVQVLDVILYSIVGFSTCHMYLASLSQDVMHEMLCYTLLSMCKLKKLLCLTPSILKRKKN